MTGHVQRQLFILRHAKSSWDDPGQDDRERPLSPRGLRAARLIAEHLTASGIAPAQVLCSPSRRTMETYDGVNPPGELCVAPWLYGASGDELIEHLRALPDSAASVMVIGHNPGLQSLVLKLAADGDGQPDPELGEVARKFPNGALATLEFSGSWSQLARGCARLTGFVRPRSLA